MPWPPDLLLGFVAIAAGFATPVAVRAVGQNRPWKTPDFTQSDALPAAAKHDWNLGPPGRRGWMFCDTMVKTDAR
ncbi:MAG: hypothetical protein FJ404_12655 [Verrucomicrobia bacterium]|nr:hypothetical protein [Verrucomicrobiota bacterium]